MTGIEAKEEATAVAQVVGCRVTAANASIMGLQQGSKVGVQAEAKGAEVQAATANIRGVDSSVKATASASATAGKIRVTNVNAAGYGGSHFHAGVEASAGVDALNVNVGIHGGSNVGVSGRRATREERGRGRGQGTRNGGEGVRVGRTAGYDLNSGNGDHSYNAHENGGGGTGIGHAVGSGTDGRTNIHLAASNSKTVAGEAKVGDTFSDHQIARSKTNHDKLHAAGIESATTLPFIHRANTSVGSSGHNGVCGLGGNGSGRWFSATSPTGQPQLGYGGAFGMVVASQVDELRPVDKGVPKSGEIKMLSDREGAKQFVTQNSKKRKWTRHCHCLRKQLQKEQLALPRVHLEQQQLLVRVQVKARMNKMTSNQ